MTNLDDFDPVFFGGQQQARPLPAVRLVDVRPVVKQHPHDVPVAVLGGDQQGRHRHHVLRLDVGAPGGKL